MPSNGPTSPPKESAPSKVSGVVPARLASNTFESFDLKANPGMREARDRCVGVADGRYWCALLAGTPGNGKTHLAIAAMNRYGLLRSMFWKVPEYLAWLRRMSIENGHSLDALTRPYREDDILLVFDDLGVEKASDWVGEQLYRVLDARYESRLPTIITTNHGSKDIDPRIISRYSPGLVVCAGKDLRERFDG